MSQRHTRAILLAASAGFVACSDPQAPTPTVPTSASLDFHGTSGACVDGATEVFISVWPKTIAAGERATFYASVSGASGSLSARTVTFTVSDPSVAEVGGPNDEGRYYATGRKGGTVEVRGNCGGLSSTASLTVTGGEVTDTTTTPPSGEIVVTLNSASLHPGETTQAVARSGTDGHASPVADVVWSTSNTAVATVTDAGLVTAVSTGSATITATHESVAGSANLAVSPSSTPTSPTPPTTEVTPPSGVTAVAPELPRADVPDARYVAPSGRVLRVGSGGGLQEALSAAQPGDVVLIAAGAVHYGNFILPNNGGGASGSCSVWTTVMTETALPSEGTRVTPSSAASYAKLYTPNVDAALKTEPRANCWRIVGIEVAAAPSFNGLHYGLLLLGNGDYSSLDLQPHGLVLDRVYVHGQSYTNLIRCVALNSARTAIINSWISDCHARGFDSQAIAGWDGPGPYLIENNQLEAAGENIMFGGADPRIVNLVPSDITIRRNHLYKPTSWKGLWTVKNLFELKSARRLLIEGNVFENNWADAQTGMAIVIKSANDGGTGPWQGTTDVTFQSNIIRNSPQGLNLAARPEENPIVPVARVKVENNLFENIGVFNGSTSGRMLILLNDLRDVSITSNTMIHNTWESGMMAILDYSNGAARNIVIRDNVATKGGPYGAIMHSGIRIGTESLNAFAGSSWAFDRNVVIGLDQEFVPWHPQSSWYAPTMASVGFANPGGSDYRLSSSSPYKGKGAGGADPGANFDRLFALTNGVVVR